MNKQDFLNLSSHSNPILSLNKKIGSIEEKTLLKLETIDTEGEIIEVEEIYGYIKFWVKYENIDIINPEKILKIK